MTKSVTLIRAGSDRAQTIDIHEQMTASQIKQAHGIPTEFQLTSGVGEPPFGEDEQIFPLLKEGGKLIAATRADAGLGA